MSKSDHRRGGITFEAAKAANFGAETANESENSPMI